MLRRLWNCIRFSGLLAIICAVACRSPAARAAESPAESGPLVNCTQLAKLLETSEVRVLDVRDRAVYLDGHVPGAAWLDVPVWETQIGRSAGLTDGAFWSRQLAALGIAADRPAVVYGDQLVWSARVCWLLRYQGVRKARLLDGGWDAWRASGGTISREEPILRASEFRAEPQPELRADLAADYRAREALPRLWDVRSEEEYCGRKVVGSRPGHIPGAIHLDWQELLAVDGRFKSPDQLRQMFAGRGLSPEAPVVVYCHSGFRSSVAFLALETAGYTHARNYLDGWRAWSADETLPAETPR